MLSGKQQKTVLLDHFYSDYFPYITYILDKSKSNNNDCDNKCKKQWIKEPAAELRGSASCTLIIIVSKLKQEKAD